MKKLLMGLTILVMTSCVNQKQEDNKNDNTEIETNVNAEVLNVDEIYKNGSQYEDKTIVIKGKVDHVCLNSHRRFKIVDAADNNAIKVLLKADDLDVKESLVGSMVEITGKLIPIKMNAEQVKKMEEGTREHHKGQEETAHFKEEIAEIQHVLEQIESGEISHYLFYNFQSESYKIIEEDSF